jgi:hypothetical protein
MLVSVKVRQSKVVDASLSLVPAVRAGLDLISSASLAAAAMGLAWRVRHDGHSASEGWRRMLRGSGRLVSGAQLFMPFCVLRSGKRRRHAALPTNMLANPAI